MSSVASATTPVGLPQAPLAGGQPSQELSCIQRISACIYDMFAKVVAFLKRLFCCQVGQRPSAAIPLGATAPSVSGVAQPQASSEPSDHRVSVTGRSPAAAMAPTTTATAAPVTLQEQALMNLCRHVATAVDEAIAERFFCSASEQPRDKGVMFLSTIPASTGKPVGIIRSRQNRAKALLDAGLRDFGEQQSIQPGDRFKLYYVRIEPHRTNPDQYYVCKIEDVFGFLEGRISRLVSVKQPPVSRDGAEQLAKEILFPNANNPLSDGQARLIESLF